MSVASSPPAQRPAGPGPDGLLIVDKPEGPTSHDVVARVRRLLHTPRVGHTGTLDPMATGVLPLVLGRATRLARFLTADEKRYRAVVQLGQATDTYDRLGAAAGPPVPVDVSDAEIDAALARFRGEISQTPPAYSAKKIGGVSAHRLARRGEAVTPAAVTVTVHELARAAWDGERLTLDVRCSAGFYVRSLAHDLGQALGCGGHLVALRRTASGEWTEQDAVPLEDADAEALRSRVIPMARLLGRLPAVQLVPDAVVRVRRGQMVRPVDLVEAVIAGAAGISEAGDISEAGGYIRLLGPDDDLVALATRTVAGLLHPSLVLV